LVTDAAQTVHLAVTTVSSFSSLFSFYSSDAVVKTTTAAAKQSILKNK